MRSFFDTAKPVLLDSASSLGFLAVFFLSGRLVPAVVCGMAVGATQLAMAMLRKQPIGALQWMSFCIVLASGLATLISHNPRFVMLKPSLFYTIAGGVMLKRGWMLRYLPPAGKQLVPDIATGFGYAWAALMFGTAILNVFAALNLSVRDWAIVMAGFGGLSKIALYLCGYASMRIIAARRRAGSQAAEG